MTTTPVVIVGAGGFGREVRDWLLAVEDYQRLAPEDDQIEFVGFLDDGEPDCDRLSRLDAPLLGGIDWLRDNPGTHYYVGVGDPATREKIAARCDELGGVAADPLIHPTAIVGSDCTFSPGTIVCPQTVVTTNVRIGQHVHLNLTTTVGHDTIIGDFVTVNPGATISGDVTLGDRVMIGTGASVNQGLCVGDQAIIGAGAAAVKDIPHSVIAVGVPAKPRA